MEILEVNLEGALNNVDGLHTFSFEEVLHRKDENDPLMQTPDGAGICKFFLKGTCQKGHQCQFRHSKSERSIVCKHWLRYYSFQNFNMIFVFSFYCRALCKKGDACEFLHRYDLSRMPECFFFSKFGIFLLELVYFR